MIRECRMRNWARLLMVSAVVLAVLPGCTGSSVQSKRFRGYVPDGEGRRPWAWRAAAAPVGKNGTPVAPRVGDDQSRVKGIVLRRGDRINIYLREIPEATMISDVIDDRGNVNLPHIGTVTLLGLTTFEAEKLIEDKYIDGEFYKSINVVIVAEEAEYFVRGEVKSPGKYKLSGDLTLLRAIISAKGYTQYANVRKVKIGSKVYDAKKIEQGKAVDPLIQPDDIIIVPEKFY